MKRLILTVFLVMMLFSAVYGQERLVFQHEEESFYYSFLERSDNIKYEGLWYLEGPYSEAVHGDQRIDSIKFINNTNRLFVYFADEMYNCRYTTLGLGRPSLTGERFFIYTFFDGKRTTSFELLVWDTDDGKRRFIYSLTDFFPFIEDHIFSFYPGEKDRLKENFSDVDLTDIKIAYRITNYTGTAIDE